MPFDQRAAVIPNEHGRIIDPTHTLNVVGEYAVGWIKRGPSGVIGTNKKDSADTTAKIGEDRDAGKLNVPSLNDPDEIAAFYGVKMPPGITELALTPRSRIRLSKPTANSALAVFDCP